MIPSTVMNSFGFHTVNTIPGTHGWLEGRDCCTKKIYTYSDLDAAQTVAISWNVLQILGYIPVLGLIPCAVRLIGPLANKDANMHNEPADVKRAHYLRGAFEGLCLGAVYIIPDILVTVHRFALSTYSGRIHFWNRELDRMETRVGIAPQ